MYSCLRPDYNMCLGIVCEILYMSIMIGIFVGIACIIRYKHAWYSQNFVGIMDKFKIT